MSYELFSVSSVCPRARLPVSSSFFLCCRLRWLFFLYHCYYKVLVFWGGYDGYTKWMRQLTNGENKRMRRLLPMKNRNNCFFQYTIPINTMRNVLSLASLRTFLHGLRECTFTTLFVRISVIFRSFSFSACISATLDVELDSLFSVHCRGLSIVCRWIAHKANTERSSQTIDFHK